jgi:hypothetical protein
MTAKLTRKDSVIVLGDDEVRIEEGFVLKSSTATEELLHDDNSAQHYYTGVRDREYLDEAGKPYTVPVVGVDAKGKVIKLGEEMHFLAYGGVKAPAERCFYIFVKRPVDPAKPTLDNGDINPHYVAEDVRKGSNLTVGEKGEGKNRTHYDYIFEEAGTRKTEDAAIAFGQTLLEKKAA